MKSFDRRKKKKKLNYKNSILSMLLISVMVFGILPRQAYSAEDISNSEIVDIKDENLEKALKEEIKKINPKYNRETIFKEDMKRIIDIDLSNKGIKSLDGIENAINLNSINLEGNEIADISILGSIPNLEKYNVSNQKIEIGRIKSSREDVEIENPLVGLDNEVIKNITGENLEVVDNFIKLKDINESKLVEVNFKEGYENKIFSGKINLDLIIEDEGIKEDKEIETYKMVEVIEINKNADLYNKNKFIEKINASNIDLNGQFVISGKSSYYGGDRDAKLDSEVASVKDNTIVIGNKGISSDRNRVQQTGMVTSKYQLDFNRPFFIKGNLKMLSSPDGMCLAFHDVKDLKVSGTGGSLGIYLNREIDKGLFLEVDTANNGTGYGDKDTGSKHMALEKVQSRGGEPKTVSSVTLNENNFSNSYGKRFEIVWDNDKGILTYSYDDKKISYHLSETELNEYFGNDKKAYMSLSAAVNFGSTRGGNVITLSFLGVDYTDTDLDTNMDIYIEGNDGREDLVTDYNKIKEEDKIIVRYKVKNKTDMAGVDSKIKLEKNNLYGSLIKLSNSNEAKWYEPYIIDNSLRTYIEGENVDSYSINPNDFFNGIEVNLNVPGNSKTRVIEYKIQIPKIVKNEAVLEQLIKTYDEGMQFVKNEKSGNIDESENLNINDQNLKNGLITNIKDKISEERPNELDSKIYRKELEVLDRVNLSNLGILDLSGLEKCTNAVEINLSSNNDITDVSVLSKISKLKSLNLSNNIKILKESLGQLLNLETLLMDNANIDDEYTDEIGKLINLKKLSLKNNKISNLNNLSSLKSLNEFYLDNNNIYDLRPIYNQVENAKKNNNKYSIKKQSVDIDRRYINSGIFELENVVYNTKNVESNVTYISNEGEYDLDSDKIVWRNISEGEHALDYDWVNDDFRFSGKVNIKLNQVPGPDYLVTIPASLDMGDVLDENSSEYDPEIDKNSINYKPDKEVTKKNPIVAGMVGAKDIISIVSDDNIIGNVNIYTDSVFTMKNIEDGKDTTSVDVYKTFDDKLNGTASSKEDVLMSLNDTNRKSIFRIKSPTSRFKNNNAEYKGTMNFIIEHVK